MFIFFEYTAIVALTLLVLALLFAVSVALLMVGEGLGAGLRVLRKTGSTMKTLNDGFRLQSHVAQAITYVFALIMVLRRRNQIGQGGNLKILRQS